MVRGGFSVGPNHVMDAPVIILSSAHDPHASAVAWALHSNNTPYRLSPSIRTDDHIRFSIRMGEAGQRVEIDGHDSTKVRSVWHRRPTLPEAGNCLEADRRFIEGQWKYLQKNLFDLSDSLLDALWVNRPRAADFAESKLAQLQAAGAAGLKVPDTIIGNHALDIAMLIKRWNRIVFKTFYPQSWQSDSSGRTYKMSAVPLDSKSELPEQAIAMSPGIYQRYIDKVFDVRVTVIGCQLFAVKMRKASGEAYFDWRPHSYDDDMRTELFPVSAVLEAKLRDLMARLGIVFGCIDLVVDRNDEVYFLEVNQAGQFLFVEESLPELRVLRAMTAMLSAGRVDYSIADCVEVTFSDYLRSDDYQQIAAVPRDMGQRVAIEP